MNVTIPIEFETLNKGAWIRCIADYTQSIQKADFGDKISLLFEKITDTNKILPVHLVTLACFVEFLVKKGYNIIMHDVESPVGKFLFDTLRFPEYWRGGQNYVPAQENSIFNLWRIVDNQKEVHSQQVHDYLQSNFFKKKDLSAVKNSLDEVYYNIFDHAEANGNAFSFIRFDEQAEKLYVAVCDFGKGIANSVREKVPSIGNDAQAIQKAMEDNFTVESRKHNRGLGLGNIWSACTGDDVLRIVSNNGFMYAKKGDILVRPNSFHFGGTLIYYELSLSHFDDLEILSNFEL